MAVVIMWMVRAGGGAFLFEEFERLSITRAGLGQIGPLDELQSRDVVERDHLNAHR